MSDEDEPDEPEDFDIEVEGDSDSEYVECERHCVIAPHGWGWAADTMGATLVRVAYKDGSVECLDNDTGKWRTPTMREVVPLKEVQH